MGTATSMMGSAVYRLPLTTVDHASFKTTISLMLLALSKSVVILFGLFLIAAGLVMLSSPKEAVATIGKFGSTVFINYSEISLRMIPAAALVIQAGASRSPIILTTVGWFMLATSLILFFVPRTAPHSFSMEAMRILRPHYLEAISPFSVLFGSFFIHAVGRPRNNGLSDRLERRHVDPLQHLPSTDIRLELQ